MGHINPGASAFAESSPIKDSFNESAITRSSGGQFSGGGSTPMPPNDPEHEKRHAAWLAEQPKGSKQFPSQEGA